jgi:ketosteroid isomerase-like protein
VSGVDLVERLAVAFNAHDVEDIGALLTDDALLCTEDRNTYTGRHAVGAAFADLFETWAEIRVDHRDCFREEDRVVWLATIRGRARSVDLELTVPYAYAIELRDGLIASIRIFPQDAEAFRAADMAGRPRERST